MIWLHRLSSLRFFFSSFVDITYRFDALIPDGGGGKNGNDADSLSTCSSSATSIIRKTRGRPAKQIYFEAVSQGDSAATISQQLEAMTNSEELPSLCDEWALIKRATLQGEEERLRMEASSKKVEEDCRRLEEEKAKEVEDEKKD